MKRIVLFQSNSGFTEKYARWIAEELGCEALPRKKVNAKELADYDQVIFGGWIMGSHIMGYDKIKALNLPHLFVFGVGATPASKELVESLRNVNAMGSEPLYYYVGGVSQEKLGFIQKGMLKMVSKATLQNQNCTEEEAKMAKALTTSFDNTRKEYIGELIQDCTK